MSREAAIFVEARAIVGPADHLYLVLHDPDRAAEFVIRAGPETMRSIFFGGTPIVVEAGHPMYGPDGVYGGSGRSDDSLDARPDTPEARRIRGSRELDLGGLDARTAWTRMVAAAEEVEEARISYNPLGTNSNATVGYVLSEIGVALEDVLPTPAGIPYFPGSDSDSIARIRSGVEAHRAIEVAERQQVESPFPAPGAAALSTMPDIA